MAYEAGMAEATAIYFPYSYVKKVLSLPRLFCQLRGRRDLKENNLSSGQKLTVFDLIFEILSGRMIVHSDNNANNGAIT